MGANNRNVKYVLPIPRLGVFSHFESSKGNLNIQIRRTLFALAGGLYNRRKNRAVAALWRLRLNHVLECNQLDVERRFYCL